MAYPEWMTAGPFKFDKVLIANRGEIACRIIRACRELGLSTVAVHTAADDDALHVELADEAFLLTGEGLSESYLNGEAIVNACRRTGANAIHPGYGFLSERADFAELVEASGLVWVGPPAKAIDAMGDKVRARRLMAEADVPLVPGAEVEGDGGLSGQMEVMQAKASAIGYPLLLKASAGGGGKGMRVVESAGELDAAFIAAGREALSSFGDGTVYIEKLLEKTRHIEVQILCDTHGGAIHLLERECSIQRRHQKVVEEAPSPILTESQRSEMGSAALSAAKAVNYVGAGTVEFLLAEDEFYFLEMNTRLQVEHPVTEMVTGVDIVHEQFRIAAGLPLSHTQDSISANGHAIEVRIYAEDPANDFLPAIGPLAVWQPPSGNGVRLDTGVRQGDEARIDFDPMLAKLIVHGHDRASATTKMVTALQDFVVLGAVTNIEFLADVISQPAFASGDTTTAFIAEHWPEGWTSDNYPMNSVLLAAAAESFGLHKGAPSTVEDDEVDPYSPFKTLTRCYP